jgi:hypothetical protein
MLINGVPEERWGTWCRHGVRIVEPHPEDAGSDYPRGRIVNPWPCDQCTLEEFIQEMKQEETDYYKSDRLDW